ncbi:TIGR02281 family clan AA aspartic protease [Novosphingobium sp.]|uniref:retropepsin-like aspartic protease family protein n=1 Tax=Novosphingobium sp. TaxID=1874826 RepID=UPI0035AEDA17
MSAEQDLGSYLASQPLILLAIAGLVLATIGWRMETRGRPLGDHLRGAGYLAMGLAVLLIVVDAARQARYAEGDFDLVGGRQARVVGSETVIPMGPDGHFTALATINGLEVPVLIDTGATYTTVEEATARRLGLAADPTRPPNEMSTANGIITARFTTAHDLRLGGIVAHDLVVAVTPDTDAPLWP